MHEWVALLMADPARKPSAAGDHQRACQMPAAKPPQAGEYVSQVMIFDVRCRSIQSIRSASGEVVDCLGALASRFANGGGSRVERVPRSRVAG